MAVQPISPDELRALYQAGQAKWDMMTPSEQEELVRSRRGAGYDPQKLREMGEAKGGQITQTAGPKIGEDDGVVPVQKGEFVIRKSAVQKYGQELLTAVNDGTAKITIDETVRGSIERALRK